MEPGLPPRDAIAGTGTSKGAADAIRRQRVDKGVSVLLAEKMDEELAAARTKIEGNNLAVDRSAPQRGRGVGLLHGGGQRPRQHGREAGS